jgi:GNAT superfamily N-acetyltransferase
VPLLGDDWQPIWKQHPRLGADMDVAVVPFNAPAESVVMPWERTPARTAPDAAPWPPLAAGDDIFIVGYPYRLTVGPLFPLWMRGTIASDPFFGYQTASKLYPCWLIDARTRSGQSGSPVMRYMRAGTVVTRNDGIVGRSINPDSDLLGVYSGRTSDESMAYLADVLVAPAARGIGLGVGLVDAMIEQGRGPGFRWMLHTKDAHGLYQKFGFTAPPSTYLERPSSRP